MKSNRPRSWHLHLVVALVVVWTIPVSGAAAQAPTAATAAQLADAMCDVATRFQVEAQEATGLTFMEDTFDQWLVLRGELADFYLTATVAGLSDTELAAMRAAIIRLRACNRRIADALPEWIERRDKARSNLGAGQIETPETRRADERVADEKEVRALIENVDDDLQEVMRRLFGDDR